MTEHRDWIIPFRLDPEQLGRASAALSSGLEQHRTQARRLRHRLLAWQQELASQRQHVAQQLRQLDHHLDRLHSEATSTVRLPTIGLLNGLDEAA